MKRKDISVPVPKKKAQLTLPAGFLDNTANANIGKHKRCWHDQHTDYAGNIPPIGLQGLVSNMIDQSVPPERWFWCRDWRCDIHDGPVECVPTMQLERRERHARRTNAAKVSFDDAPHRGCDRLATM